MNIKEKTLMLFEQYIKETDRINKIKIRNQIVELNMPLVVKIVNSKFASIENKEDLYQVGYLGLIRAVEKYDPQKGSFSTYATWFILQKTTFAISTDRNIHIPSYVLNELLRFRKSHSSFNTFDWKIPKEYAVAGICAIKETSLDAPSLSTEEYDSLHDILCDDTRNPVETEAIASVMAKDIGKALSALSQREINILYRRIVNGETQKEVGKDLGITGGRVGSLEARALRRLQVPIRCNGIAKSDYPEFFSKYMDKNSATSYVNAFDSIENDELER